MQPRGLAGWLGTLDEDELARVLRLRPDALARPQPTSLLLLADRLSSARSVGRAMAELDARVLTVTEVLQTLNRGPDAGVDAAAAERLVGPAGRMALERALELLTERALVWPGPPEATGRRVLHLADGLAEFWRSPLELGAPLAGLLEAVPQPRRVALAEFLDGGRPHRTAAAAKQAILTALTNPSRVRLLARDLSGEARAILDTLIWADPRVALPISAYTGLRLSEPADELLASGLVLPVGYSHAEMPREVGLALRGDDYHPPIPDPAPPMQTRAAAADTILRQMAHAVPDAVQAVGDLVALCGRAPLALLKTGGIGVRELRRAAKTVGRPEAEVGFWLDVAARAGLVAAGAGEVAPTPAYDRWRGEPPAERWLPIADAWWRLRHVPGHRVDEMTGAAVPVLAPASASGRIARLRQDMLATLADLPSHTAVTGVDELLLHLGVRRPMMYAFGDDTSALAGATWAESERLGLTAAGALTPVGRAYVRSRASRGATPIAPESGEDLDQGGDGDGGTRRDGDARAELIAALRSVVPDAQAVATFQADLTAVVAGPPSARLADLLDAAADVESRGAATCWRFSAASVRRALDAGRTADSLVAELAAVTAHPLPQPLVYLIHDVGRRHGAVQVTAAGCCLVSEDTGLLAELLAGAGRGRLADLCLRALAPTVLVSARPVADTLTALRAAGYAPVKQGADGAPVLTIRTPARTEPPAPDPFPGAQLPAQRAGPDRWDAAGADAAGEHLADAAALARRLLSAPRRAGTPAASAWTGGALTDSACTDGALAEAAWTDSAGSAPDLRRAAPHLDEEEVRLLAYAVDTGEPVHIDYVDTNGSHTGRVVERLELLGDALVGWCRLRRSERMFLVRSVQAVAPP